MENETSEIDVFVEKKQTSETEVKRKTDKHDGKDDKPEIKKKGDTYDKKLANTNKEDWKDDQISDTEKESQGIRQVIKITRLHISKKDNSSVLIKMRNERIFGDQTNNG